MEDFEKISENFKNLQNYIVETHEKTENKITLIEERFLVLENIMELEKNEIINSNKELLYKIKQLTDKKNNFEDLENGNNKYNNYKIEIKNLTDENNVLKSKIKEQEKNIFQLQKKILIFNVMKEEKINNIAFIINNFSENDKVKTFEILDKIADNDENVQKLQKLAKVVNNLNKMSAFTQRIKSKALENIQNYSIVQNENELKILSDKYAKRKRRRRGSKTSTRK